MPFSVEDTQWHTVCVTHFKQLLVVLDDLHSKDTDNHSREKIGQRRHEKTQRILDTGAKQHRPDEEKKPKPFRKQWQEFEEKCENRETRKKREMNSDFI